MKKYQVYENGQPSGIPFEAENLKEAQTWVLEQLEIEVLEAIK